MSENGGNPRRQLHDVAVIGGGVVGCALLSKLQSVGYDCVLLEKASHLVAGASCGNSGIRHCGYDTQAGTLESRCIMAAGPIADRFYNKTGIPQIKCGAVMVAWNKDQVNKLPVYLEKAKAAQQHDVRLISREEVFDLEPQLSRDALGGLYVPGESIIDPWLTCIGLAHLAVKLGAQVMCDSEVLSGERNDEDGVWSLKTRSGDIQAKLVINAAGLYGDEVNKINSDQSFRIMPRKGDYAIFDKEARKCINHIILPVPTEKTKGIIIFPTVYDNVMVGPTAEEVDERDAGTAMPDQSVVEDLVEWAYRIVPALKQAKVVGSYCGIRPATQFKDYQIKIDPDRQWVTVGGIRSTGATACMGIAQHVAHLISQHNILEQTKSQEEDCFDQINWQKSSEGKLRLENKEYYISHPIAKFGLSQ